MAAPRIARLARAFADVFFPRFCIICQTPMDHDRAIDLCPSCESAIRLPEGRYCPKCSAPMGQYARLCPNCHNMHLVLNGTAAFGFYDEVLRDRVLEFKFSSRRYLSRTFGGLVAMAVNRKWPDIVIDAVTAAPLHRSRRRERGFDQARAVAFYAAKALNAPYRPRILTRVRATETQVGLTKTARIRNMRGAFEARPAPAMKTVLIVDDIMTTGATLSEAARALKKAGAGRVYAAVVARTGPAGQMDVQGQSLTLEGQTI